MTIQTTKIKVKFKNDTQTQIKLNHKQILYRCLGNPVYEYLNVRAQRIVFEGMNKDSIHTLFYYLNNDEIEILQELVIYYDDILNNE